ncbi:unnamed protein product [Strongylus vulgaris]|uniref:Uncharacterized protein n=1 Tax=Strongylus vulgaris TaxID=40348 RepID=A0A3P7L774_STRVU|nr:unnamed protein product [Strongylus vulgaris]
MCLYWLDFKLLTCERLEVKSIEGKFRYIHKVSRHGVQVLKETFMVGSYAPKQELQSYTTPVEEAPSGA